MLDSHWGGRFPFISAALMPAVPSAAGDLSSYRTFEFREVPVPTEHAGTQSDLEIQKRRDDAELSSSRNPIREQLNFQP
jgi:hypothetical protein